MFDIGFQELIIIFIVALLVFGPEKLPEVGRTLGKWIIEIRKGVQNAKVQMDSEFADLEKTVEKSPQQDSEGADRPEKDGNPTDAKEKV